MEERVKEFKSRSYFIRTLRHEERLHKPGEQVIAWLLWCWDNGVDSQQLEGKEAKWLGSLTGNQGIQGGTGKEEAIFSFYSQLLSNVRARHPLQEDLVNSQGKRTTADEGIQHLREWAVLEVIYGVTENDEVSKDPEDVLYTWAMWGRWFKMLLHHILTAWQPCIAQIMGTPTANRVSSWLQNLEESLRTSSSLWVSTLAVRGTLWNQSSATVRGKESPRHMLCDTS